MDKQTLRGLIAQAWCAKANAHKTLDGVLVFAIADIVWEEIAKLKAENEEMAKMLASPSEEQVEIATLKAQVVDADKLNDALKKVNWEMTKQLTKLEKT